MTAYFFFIVAVACVGGSAAWGKVLPPKMVRSIQKTIACVGISSTLLVGSGPVWGDVIPLVGAEAPAFSLPSNKGSPISLSDLKGKWTVLYYYPGDFTQSCTIEAQAFQRDLPLYQKLGVGIIGVSVDKIDKHLDFSKSYRLDFPLLSDEGGVVSDKFGSLLNLGFLGKFSNRQTYIISPDLKVAAVFTKVEDKLAKHSTEVLAKLEELVGKP